MRIKDFGTRCVSPVTTPFSQWSPEPISFACTSFVMICVPTQTFLIHHFSIRQGDWGRGLASPFSPWISLGSSFLVVCMLTQTFVVPVIPGIRLAAGNMRDPNICHLREHQVVVPEFRMVPRWNILKPLQLYLYKFSQLWDSSNKV